jgi:hypothetical protein
VAPGWHVSLASRTQVQAVDVTRSIEDASQRIRKLHVRHENDAVTQSLRCYSPADLHLLLEGTGLSVVDVEHFTDEGYSEPCELADAMLYLATLAPA